MTADNLNSYEGDKAYLEDMTPPIGQEPSETHLTPDQIAELRIAYSVDEDGREETPKAFLLNRSDAKYLLKASVANTNAWTRLLFDSARENKKAVGGVIDETAILQEVEKAWKEQEISVSKLQRIYKKTEGKDFWTYRTASLLLPKEDNEGNQDFETTFVIFKNGVVLNSFPTEGDKGQAFLNASNPIDRGKIGEVPEGIKYLPYNEQAALDDMRTIVEALANKEKGVNIKEALNLSIMPNSPVIDVFSEVGRQSIREKVQGELSLKGEQTSTVISSKGVSIISLSGNEDLLLSADTDRVLKVFIETAQQNGYKDQTCTIPIREVTQRIGLKDIKETGRKIAQALDELYACSLEWQGPDNYFFKSRIASSAGIIPRKGRGGSVATITFGKDFWEHLRSDRTGLYQIPKDATKIRDDNAYKMLLELFRLYRLNVGKKNEGIVSVKTLLGVCNIIPYEDLGKDKGKASQRIIRPFTNALETLVDLGYLKEWTFNYMARDSKDPTLTDEDQEKAYRNYKFFSGLAIHYAIDPNYEPDYSELVKSRNRNRRKALNNKTTKTVQQ